MHKVSDFKIEIMNHIRITNFIYSTALKKMDRAVMMWTEINESIIEKNNYYCEINTL